MFLKLLKMVIEKFSGLSLFQILVHDVFFKVIPTFEVVP